jgi:hypothetical protein
MNRTLAIFCPLPSSAAVVEFGLNLRAGRNLRIFDAGPVSPIIIGSA